MIICDDDDNHAFWLLMSYVCAGQDCYLCSS